MVSKLGLGAVLLQSTIQLFTHKELTQLSILEFCRMLGPCEAKTEMDPNRLSSNFPKLVPSVLHEQPAVAEGQNKIDTQWRQPVKSQAKEVHYDAFKLL